MSEINQTINNPYEEYDSEADRVAVDFNDEGFVKNITIEEGPEGMGDVQAGIEFIYHMREHLVDVTVATAYLFACYALYLYLKKVIK
tara:strand:- start:281 stop:541 length:261 start_codon:yes stop_codon:yes gene_type:complete